MSEIASHSNHNQQLAVFLDRDGTLFDVPNQFEINPKTIEALKQLQNKFQLFILSNECAYTIAGVPPLQAEEINTTIDQSLSEAGIQIKEWFVYSGEKKKITEYIELCKHKYELNLENSFLINDHPNEEDNARELGITQLYLLTSRGGKHLAKLNPETLIFHKIQNVASWIFNHPSHREALDAKIHEAANVIKSGGVAAFPTDTVYGLGADVFQPDAVAKIFMIKGRPQNNPLIAHIADYDQLAILVDDVPDKARILMDAFWPGPLTIVFPKKHSVPDIVTANIPTVAVLMPAQPIA